MPQNLSPQGVGIDAYRGSILKAPIAAPSSGPTGSGAGTYAWPSSILYCTVSKVLFKNEGTLASPYWTPLSFGDPALFGFQANFSNNVGKAHANTDTATDLGQGIKVSGQGIAETDSGLVITVSEAGRIARLTTTDEDAHLVSLSPVGTNAVFQPDTHGPVAVDITLANVSAITLRSLFLGFCGSNADTLDPVATGSTVTVSFAATIGDDVAGLLQSTGLTSAARLMCISDKGNANATQLVTAAGVNSGVDIPAAGTFFRLRVEVDATGGVRYFKDKVQIGYRAAALDVDEEISPLFYVASTSTAVKAVDVKQFSAWGVAA